MENLSGAAIILAVCLIVLAIGALGRKAEWLINFVLRGDGYSGHLRAQLPVGGQTAAGSGGN